VHENEDRLHLSILSSTPSQARPARLRAERRFDEAHASSPHGRSQPFVDRGDVAALSGSDHDRHGLLALFDGQVELGGQAAARATEAVVGRFGGDAAGRFDLQVPLFRAGSVLVCPADGGIDVDVPGDELLRIGLGL
jgi:hypothetical protein